MARKWSGFLPQNLSIKEEWELLEACEAQARLAEQAHHSRKHEDPPPDKPEPHSRNRAHKRG